MNARDTRAAIKAAKRIYFRIWTGYYTYHDSLTSKAEANRALKGMHQREHVFTEHFVDPPNSMNNILIIGRRPSK